MEAAFAAGRARRCGASSATALPGAFTLVEMLVVIAIIGVLASMIFPVTRAVNRTKIKSRTRTEMEQIATAIEVYKAKRGHYPPDNPGNPYTNQLYYELVGTTFTNASYVTSDGQSQVPTNRLPAAFGANVSGFINSSLGGGGEEGSRVVNCLRTGVRANQVGSLPPVGVKVLVGSVPLPAKMAAVYPGVTTGGYCAWRYNSSTPVYNPGSYDLWVDVVIDGRTNRICNWSRDALIVGKP